jgi:hypothetical protein
VPTAVLPMFGWYCVQLRFETGDTPRYDVVAGLQILWRCDGPRFWTGPLSGVVEWGIENEESQCPEREKLIRRA